MSGIHGIVRFDGGAVSQRDLERQSNALAHRGPDRRNFWHDGAVGMGHLLMRITAEDSFDAQPVHDRNAGLTLVADARLDNREELAGALAIDAAQLRELPDSALLLKAYRRWGTDCVEHLIGDFVFAVWDAPERKLVLGRDHMGQRHVFFHRGQNFFAFASEPKGLWALPDCPKKLSDIGMGRLIVFDLMRFEGNTHFEEIFGLHGGTVMTITAAGNVERRRYWTPHADPVHLNRDEAYYVETYRRVLAEAVACRLRRNVHAAGLFLAGGFDSGAIAGLAGPVVTAQRRKLIAVSSVLPASVPDKAGNARKWVKLLARDMPHLDVHYVTREGLDIFSGMTAGFLQVDGLRGPNRYVNEALMQTARAAGARILMDGYGGDYTINPRAPRWLLRLLLRGHARQFQSEFRAYRRFAERSPVHCCRIGWAGG